MTKLPRLQASTPFVTLQTGNLSPQGAPYLETLILALESALNGLSDQQAALANQIAAIQTALDKAGIALATANAALAASNSASSGSQVQTAPLTTADVIDGTWTLITSVTFSAAVSASQVTLEGSGPAYGGVVNGNRTFNGEVRVVQSIAGVDSVLQTVPFSAVYTPANPGDGDPADTEIAFSGFTYSAADSHTGAITYRLEAHRAAGSTTYLGATYGLQVTRTP